MRLWMAAAGLLLILTGCHRTAARPEPYQSVAEDTNRDTKTARLENAKALKDIDKELLGSGFGVTAPWQLGHQRLSTPIAYSTLVDSRCSSFSTRH